MCKKGLAVGLLLCSLFSGQIFAARGGHEFYRIQNADHLLRHLADSDEIRARAEDAADELRENHQERARKPGTRLV